MRQLRISNLGGQSLGDLESTPFDEGLSVGRKKFVQHWCRFSLSLSPLRAVPHIAPHNPRDLVGCRRTTMSFFVFDGIRRSTSRHFWAIT